jgi:hypothetical protein
MARAYSLGHAGAGALAERGNKVSYIAVCGMMEARFCSRLSLCDRRESERAGRLRRGPRCFLD